MGVQLLNAFLIGILGIHFVGAQESAPCASGMSFDCVNCTTRAVCDSGKAMLSAINCEEDTPYCNEGTCTSVIPETGCSVPASPLCPALGTFPSINSCRKYIKCDADKRSTEYTCPQFLVYDPKAKACKRRVEHDDCPVIRCSLNIFKRLLYNILYNNDFVVYPLDKRLYFYCGTSADDIKLLQCPEEKEFNPTTVICENICKNAGSIAAPDPKKFFMCVKNGNKYDKFLTECPSGLQFDESSNECQAPTPKE